MRKAKVLASILTITSLCLAACGSSTTGGTTSAVSSKAADITSAISTTASAGTTSATGDTGFKEVPREKTVIFENIEGRVSDPSFQNPYSAAVYLDYGMWQANQESLFYYNYETGKIEPWQAESYEYNKDFTECTIKLKNGVKWQDGEKFDADDVIFTIKMIQNNDGLRYSADLKDIVKDIVKVDDLTVKFVLSKPKPSFLSDYFVNKVWDTLPIAAEHVWSKVSDPVNFKNFDVEKGYPLGTGPYKLVRSTDTEQVLDRCDSWWGAETGFNDMPEPERCIWITCSSEEVRAAQMVNNELDSSWTMSVSTFETAKAKNSNIIAWSDTLPYGYLDAVPSAIGFNCAKAPWDDKDVRWAICYAINQQEIVDIAAEGGSEPAQTMYPTYPKLKAWLTSNQDILDKYDVTKHDPNLSASLMESKGYKKGSDGYWVGSDGKKLSFEILYRSGESLNIKEAPIVEQELRDAGFDVKMTPLESAAFYTKIYTGDYDLAFRGTLGSVSDPLATMEMFHSKYYKPIGETGDNRCYRWRNADYDKLIDEMSTLSPDDPTFIADSRKALEIWLENVPTCPIMQQMFIVPFNNTYWTNWPTSKNNYTSPTQWWYNCNYIIHNIHAVKK